MTTVIHPDLAADFAALVRLRMKVRVSGPVAQRSEEFVEPAGGNLLCAYGCDVSRRYCSLYRRWPRRTGPGLRAGRCVIAQERHYPAIHIVLAEMNVSEQYRAAFYTIVAEFE